VAGCDCDKPALQMVNFSRRRLVACVHADTPDESSTFAAAEASV
jgi:hypothetical protein